MGSRSLPLHSCHTERSKDALHSLEYSDHKVAVIQGIWQLHILQPTGLLIEPTKISTI